MGLGAYADRYHQADDRTMHTSVPLNDEQKNAVSADEKRWNTRALIVDDDVPIRELLIDYLARFNILATGVTDGTAMRVAMQAETFDVVVLDLMLPGQSGLHVCRAIRAVSDTPIVILTAKEDDLDHILGLESGADDYVIKPIKPRCCWPACERCNGARRRSRRCAVPSSSGAWSLTAVAGWSAWAREDRPHHHGVRTVVVAGQQRRQDPLAR